MDFDSKEFARRFHYDGGDLGARLTEKGTEFRPHGPKGAAAAVPIGP